MYDMCIFYKLLLHPEENASQTWFFSAHPKHIVLLEQIQMHKLIHNAQYFAITKNKY